MTRREDFEAAFDQRNSLTYWYPALLELGLPAPRTTMISLPLKEVSSWIFGEGELSDSFKKDLLDQATHFGYPFFMRTDEASNKFEYQDACVVNNSSELIKKFARTIEFNEEVEVPYRHIVFRELLKPDFKFTAYKGMPVTRERRYFARDGIYQCHHPYWFPQVITDRWSQHNPRPPNNWRELMAETNKEQSHEVAELMAASEQITKKLRDYWSVDFLYANDQWWITDMAIGKASFHYPECRYAPKEEKED